MQQAFGRPFRPLELTASTLTSFPIRAMAQQLMSEESFQQSGRNALTLMHNAVLTVVLTVLKAGAVLHEHRAPAPVTLVPLFGQIVLFTDEGKARLTLDQENTAVFAANLPHRVEAHQDSAFLLIMGGQA
jgi:quercetin dioxygenase-like cupin family protein